MGSAYYSMPPSPFPDEAAEHNARNAAKQAARHETAIPTSHPALTETAMRIRTEEEENRIEKRKAEREKRMREAKPKGRKPPQSAKSRQ